MYKFIKWILFLFMISKIVIAQEKTIKVPIIRKPEIDGTINLSEWHGASLDSGFIQLEPLKGLPATEKTHIRMGMDNKHLFVAFECNAVDVSTISAGNPQRDHGDMATDDAVSILIDTFHDKRSGYLFHVNVLNTQTDMRIENNGGSIDNNWDTEWLSATRKHENGWSAEFAIPFRGIKFSSSSKNWGVNFARIVPRNREIAWWSGTLEDNMRVSQAGVLEFSEKSPRERKPTTLIPYINGYNENLKKWKEEIGLDCEIPVTSDMSANITINPDFASVEGDKEVINLDPWDIKYPEKRPFFRDVGALFDMRYNIFYSRRIGDISHGEKLYGKVGTFQIAGVYARTNEIADDSDASDNSEYFPQSNFIALRVQKDILSSSTIGITAVEKNWKGGYHRVIGLDTKMYLPYQIKATGQLFISAPVDSRHQLSNYTGGFIRVARETNFYHYHLRLTSLGSNLKENFNAVGYLQYDDAIELDGEFWYKYFPSNNKTIKFVYYCGNYKWDWSQDKVLERYEIRQDIQTYFTNRLSIEGRFRYEYRDLMDPDWGKTGQTHNYKRTLDIQLGYNTLEWSFARAGLSFGNIFDGPFYAITADTRLKLFNILSLTYELDIRCYDKSRADSVATNWDIHILGADIRFTPDLFLRIFSQYRSDKDRFYFYGRFGYRYKPPNSAIYFTYSYDEENYRKNNSLNRILFLKVSHEFTLF
jgi:hypothetical protein